MPHRFDRLSLVIGSLAAFVGLWALVTGSMPNFFAIPWGLAMPVLLFVLALLVLGSLRPRRRAATPSAAPLPEPVDPLVAEALAELNGPGFTPVDLAASEPPLRPTR